MSLLVKALEKAAQDRDKNPAAAPATAAKSSSRDLELEAVDLKPGIKADENTSRVPIGGKQAAAAPAGGSMASAHGLSASAKPPRSSAQAHAATILGTPATSRRAGTLVWLQTHPVYVLGGAAVLFMLLYGAYVYLQIAHPTLLQRTPPRAQAPATPPGGTVNATAMPRVDATVPPSTELPASKSLMAERAGMPATSATADASRETAGNVPPRITPAGTLRAPAPALASPVPQATAKTLLPQARVAVSRGDNNVARVNPLVGAAYTALETGQWDHAQQLYERVLRAEPANIDARLGLAALAQRDNRSDDAQRHFAAILEVDPRNAHAQAGLIGLMGGADPQAAESRLKQLLAREPSPQLYFSLGNLYAEQGRWPQAQQAYFQAHHLEGHNPEYAYNLAVGLEHLGQQKLALNFYRKAVQLAANRGGANFDAARTQQRIAKLAAQFE